MKNTIRNSTATLLLLLGMSMSIITNAQTDGSFDAPTCNECDGKIDNIIFRFDGSQTSFVEIESRRGRQYQTLYAGYLDAYQQFSVSGSSNLLDRKGTLGATIYVRVDGGDRLSLHTSCSEPIGPGTVVGDLVVITATSRNGGLTCPVGPIPPIPPVFPPFPPVFD